MHRAIYTSDQKRAESEEKRAMHVREKRKQIAKKECYRNACFSTFHLNMHTSFVAPLILNVHHITLKLNQQQ